MSGRKRISLAVQDAVLLKSRRRCSICFGLNRDTDIKAGQIAHLDKDSSNNAEENLVFLCFQHHDEYDSSTSQRKGLTQGEVKAFRDELISSVFQTFRQKVRFGFVEFSHSDPWAGKWVRLDCGANSAELDLTPLPDNIEGNPQYFVSGFALKITTVPDCPNIGVLEGVGVLHPDGDLLIHGSDSLGHITTLRLTNGSLEVNEENWFGVYGMGVNYIGRYGRS